MRICLIRHGETEWNKTGRWQGREDIPLNETGISQAENCANRLKGNSFTRVITSPLARAVQTGQIIGKALNINIFLQDERLIECDLGIASGMLREQRRKRFPDRVYPGKEEDAAVGKRMKECLFDVVNQYQNEDILIVSHGNALQNLFLSLFPSPDQEGRDADQGVMGNGHYSILEYKNGKFQIISYDQ